MEERVTSRQHKVILTDRSSGVLNGVLDILSFDINELLLETEQGMLMIKGKDLHVKRLTLEKGELEITGLIDSLIYSDLAKKDGDHMPLLGRLFR